MMDWSMAEFTWLGEVMIRLLVATVLGGLVGYEREQANRPAGFRTHILVSLGSALVMVTAEYIFRRYSPLASFDPMRMGAQVISGIGFLGAGTIIRNGSSVKGLTTAASLWAVSCIGLACGSGFYAGALLATLFVFLTLITLKKLELKLTAHHGQLVLLIQLTQYGQDVSEILRIAGEMKVDVRKMQLQPTDSLDAGGISVRLVLHKVTPEIKAALLERIYKQPSVRSIQEE